MSPAAMMFYLLASVCLVSAVMVVTRRNPVHAALFLVLTFFCVAGIYVILSAEFLAAVQVLVYAGGIMVLFLFVIMLVPLEKKMPRPRLGHVVGSVLLAVVLTCVLILSFSKADVPAAQGELAMLTDGLSAGGGNIEAVGMELYTRYLLPFEMVSLLLLVAMVGAIFLARRKV